MAKPFSDYFKDKTKDECIEKARELAKLLLEARDALPAISLVGAKLHNVDLTLADRIEASLEPWCDHNGTYEERG